MKSKEEIEQLATKHYRSNGSGGGQYTEGLQEGRLIGYVDGYTQCQVDMAKEIEKYKLFKSKILTAYNIHQGNIHDLRASLNESLNKQN